jgi:para-nitrobenzyl esterase
VYAASAPLVLAEYPASNYAPTYSYTSYGLALVQAETDYAPIPGLEPIEFCYDVETWSMGAAANGAPLYAYEFNDPASTSFFGSPGPGVAPPLPAASQTLSNTMVQYWTNCIKLGNPNGTGLPNWPPYSGPTTAMQLIPGAVGTGKDTTAEHHCAFWNSNGFVLSLGRQL